MDFSASVPLVRLAGYQPQPRVHSLLSEDDARSLGILPLYVVKGKLVAACLDPRDRRALRRAAALVRMPIQPVAATIPELRAAFDRVYHFHGEPTNTPEPAEILYRLGYLTSSTIQQAVQNQRSGGKPPMQIWLESGLITEEGQVEANGWIGYLPYLRASSLNPQPGLGMLLSEETARNRKVLPLWWVKGILVVAIPCCDEAFQIPDINELPGVPLRVVVTTRQAWDRLYRKIYLVGRHAVNSIPETLSYLQRNNVLSQSDLHTARAVSENTASGVENVLLDREVVTYEEWTNARTKILGIEPGYFPEVQPESALNTIIPLSIAHRLNVAPITIKDGCLRLAMVEPHQESIHLIESITGYPVEPCLVHQRSLDNYLAEIEKQVQPYNLFENPGLDDFLLTMGIVPNAQVLSTAVKNGIPGESPAETYLRLGLIDEIDLCEVLSLQTGIPLVQLHHAYFDDNLIRKIPFGLYVNHQLMPVAQKGGDIWVAVADPLDNTGLLAVEEATGQRVWPLIAPRSVIVAALKHTFDQGMRSVPEQIRTVMQYFVRNQHISQVQASQVLEEYSDGIIPLDQAIVKTSNLSEDSVAQVMAAYLGLMKVDLDLQEDKVEVIDPLGQRQVRTRTHDPVNIDAARLIDLETAIRLGALPVKRAGNEIGVAFASLPLEGNVRMLEKMLSLKIIPLIAGRTSLENAIHRTLGHQNLGTRMLVAGVINRRQLNEALDLASKTGVRLGRALINRGFISEQQLYHFLAEQSGLPLSNLDPTKLDGKAARLIEPELERSLGVLPLAVLDGRITLAVVDPLNEDALNKVSAITKTRILPVLVTEADLERALEALYHQEYLNTSVLELLERTPDDSAYSVLSRGQKAFILISVILSIVWLWFDHRGYLIFINILSTIFYLSFSAYKFYLIYRAMNVDLEVPVTHGDIAALDDRDLPVYTILVPVYQEKEVLSDLIQALTNLDYPVTKLDIKILFESDDEETLAAFRAIDPPPQFQAISVPSSLPKTKPKACNYGLIHARGDYVVIFDAEDLPDRDQLKRVLVGFSRVPDEVVCIQTKLNYYNRNQNLLTRWFTVEYSMWFDLFLPGLDASHAPIPLGGTSNHFKKTALVQAGAWDPFNVTEDADLGMRIFKRGFRTAIVDSTTYEEANSQLFNWVRQRSRWIKGYIQTWLVHMRHPLRLWNEVGPMGFFSFQFVVGGTFFAALMNPIYWALTTLWFLGRWEFVEALYPGVIFFFGSICLYLGNFAFTYMNVAGAMRRGYYDMVKFALLSPLYWGLISIAAWRGLFQLITRPHFWEKTVHGLSRLDPGLDGTEQPTPPG